MRYTGTIEPFADVDVRALVDWLMVIPEADWRRMSDEAWLGWGDRFRPLATTLVRQHFPGCAIIGIGMFVLKAGVSQPAHKDEQPPEWVTRVHVPLITNPGAIFTMDDGEHHMEVGKAYRMNTLATHAVENRGKTSRVHFMWDIKG